MTKILKNKINNAGTHVICGKKSIEYGIDNGTYWYYCHTCKKYIQPYECTKSELRENITN